MILLHIYMVATAIAALACIVLAAIAMKLGRRRGAIALTVLALAYSGLFALQKHIIDHIESTERSIHVR